MAGPRFGILGMSAKPLHRARVCFNCQSAAHMDNACPLPPFQGSKSRFLARQYPPGYTGDQNTVGSIQLSRLSGHRLLDVREALVFERGHLSGAYNIPFPELSDRSWELPPKGVHLQICTDEASAIEVSAWFESRALFYQLGSDPLLVLCARTILEAQAQGMWEEGPSPVDRLLFQPCPLLAAEIQAVENACPVIFRRALDLGSGAGRDVIYLAIRGWLVVGIDTRAPLLARCSALASRKQIGHAVHCIQGTLTDGESLVHLLQNVPASFVTREGEETASAPSPIEFDLVLFSRYWDPQLLPGLVALMRPGGLLLVHHFSSDSTWPNNSNKLGSGELKALCQALCLEVLRDEVLLTKEADERPMTYFVARRPR